MPELPEVETIVRGLERRVVGDTIESVWIGSRKQPLKSSPATIAAFLEGARVARVHRAGKHIVFELAAGAGRRESLDGKEAGAGRPRNRRRVAGATPIVGATHIGLATRVGPTSPISVATSKTAMGPGTASAQWVVHLGMTGRMIVCEPADEIEKHTHLIAKLASGREIRFVDPRMFGKLSVHSGGFDPGGVEPLEVSEEDFVQLFRGRKTPIKSALLNQKLLRGVGNIYADESLFRAGIRPRRRAAAVTRQEFSKLHHSVRDVLLEAIALGGSSVSDYVDADGEEGFFQLEHRVYGREGEPCRVCGAAIRRVVLAGRSSHYCLKCQK